MGQTPSPQLSPDGRFYWDGQRWVSVPTSAHSFGGYLLFALAALVSLGMVVGGAATAVFEANNRQMCDNGLGQFAQGASQDVSQQCSTVSLLFYGGIAAAAIGALVFIAVLVIELRD